MGEVAPALAARCLGALSRLSPVWLNGTARPCPALDTGPN